MTTPIDSTSPFINSPANEKGIQEVPVDMSDFSIHTMQDELLELQKKGNVSENSPVSNVSEKNTPSQPPVSDLKPKEDLSIIASAPAKKVGIPSKKEDFGEVYAPAQKNTRFIVLIMAIALVTVFVVLGGYYFLFGRSFSQNLTNNVAETSQTIEIQQPAETPPETTSPALTEKYSSEKPNYLTLDLATLSPENIKEKIIGIAEELKLQPDSRVPYEFVVVDVNNNPVAFPIFATAAKLNLSPLILNNLGETFSLFIYDDAGNPRLSFVADVAKDAALSSELLKQEKTFIADATFLFLNESPKIISGPFQDSAYKNIPIRFFNVNSQITMSIDYSFINNKLIVSTSKNTMRILIDYLLTKNILTTAPQSIENTEPLR